MKKNINKKKIIKEIEPTSEKSLEKLEKYLGKKYLANNKFWNRFSFIDSDGEEKVWGCNWGTPYMKVRWEVNED